MVHRLTGFTEHQPFNCIQECRYGVGLGLRLPIIELLKSCDLKSIKKCDQYWHGILEMSEIEKYRISILK